MPIAPGVRLLSYSVGGSNAVVAGTIRPDPRRALPEQAGVAALVGLLIVLLGYAVTELVLSRRAEVAEQHLAYDLALADTADDVTLAIHVVRERHLELADGPTPQEVSDFDSACSQLFAELDRLADVGVRADELPQPAQLRLDAGGYYAVFRASVETYGSDPAAFAEASDRGLRTLDRLDHQATTIDDWADGDATTTLGQVDSISQISRQALLLALGLLVPIVGVMIVIAKGMIDRARESYAQQRVAAEALADAAQAKLDFLADISHELRTPLTVLRGNAEVALTLDSACVHAESLQEIVAEAARTSRMVEDLLFLARADSAAPPLEPELVDVAPFLAEVAARAETVVRERAVTLVTDLQGDGRLRIDPIRVQQAIMNLVDNAAKHTPPGESVMLRSQTNVSEICVEVVDRGPGIPEAELPHIFERFYRAGGSRDGRSDGTGLGLAIVKAVADAHGARVTAMSRVDDETRMGICIPFAEI
jgi:signal transduction histidine kinase